MLHVGRNKIQQQHKKREYEQNNKKKHESNSSSHEKAMDEQVKRRITIRRIASHEISAVNRSSVFDLFLFLSLGSQHPKDIVCHRSQAER